MYKRTLLSVSMHMCVRVYMYTEEARRQPQVSFLKKTVYLIFR